MIELPASKILVVDGIEDDPRTAACAARLRRGIPADEEIRVNDDAELARLVEQETNKGRERTGLVCQPAWQFHTIVGCHFRCAYCGLGWVVNIFLNMEEYVERLDRELRTVWDAFSDDLGRAGQNPDDYICNSGPHSHPETVGAWG